VFWNFCHEERFSRGVVSFAEEVYILNVSKIFLWITLKPRCLA
jgi:hypothetical protein